MSRRVILCVVAGFALISSTLVTPSRGIADTDPAPPSRGPGVLVLAHGGTNQWDAVVRKAVKQASLDYPTEVAFGMGMHSQEVRALQQSVEKLQRKGIDRILVIPLLVSSHSEVYRQYEYLLGLRPQPEWPQVQPVRLLVPVVMGRALDDDPIVSDVLLARVKAMSRKPDSETVVIVAHGPNGDDDNREWLADMERLAARLSHAGGFREVVTKTIRDDAPKVVHDSATSDLREMVRASALTGPVLVVPLLMARGGVERKIPVILSGSSYEYTGETLLPDPRLATWIARQANELATRAPAAQAGDDHNPSHSSTEARAGGSVGSAAVIQ